MRRPKGTDLYFAAAYGYLLLPVVIFALGWARPYYGVPVTVCVLFSLYRMVRTAPERWRCAWDKGSVKRLLLAAGLVLFWVAMSGVGGFAFQNEDHIWRNSMFEMLVREDWPVVREVTVDGVQSTRGFSYYMGFWMVPALAGKVFGVRTGYYFQVLWAFGGIMLFYYGVCIVRGKISLWPLIVFILFSGADIMGCYLSGTDLSSVSSAEHLEWWTMFQFSSMTTQLFWVFNQAIPAWLITILLYLQKSNRAMVVILSTGLLHCTMPSAGLIPVCAYWCFSRSYEGKRFSAKWWKEWLRDTFTVENILGGGTVGILSCLFLARPLAGSGELFLNLRNGGWLVYAVFLLVEIGGFCAIVYRYRKRDPLFYIAVVCLCLCPVLQIYEKKNFCMRASIPALVLLFLFVIDALERSCGKKSWIHLAAAAAVLAVGLVTPAHEMVRTISQNSQIYIAQEDKVRLKGYGTERVLQNSNESIDAEKNVFYRYIAR